MKKEKKPIIKTEEEQRTEEIKERKELGLAIPQRLLTSEEKQEADNITRLALEQPIVSQSELTGVMKEMNEDILEGETRLPSIDMKTRLAPMELTSMIIHDAVIALGCLPKECLITTRTKKRLAVSLKGMGREEMVKIVQAEREKTSGEGAMNKIKNLFTPKS